MLFTIVFCASTICKPVDVPPMPKAECTDWIEFFNTNEYFQSPPAKIIARCEPKK